MGPSWLDAQGALVPGASRITINLNTLVSDESRRDNFVRTHLSTTRYPNAVIVLNEAVGLPSPLPTSGSATFQLKGQLTVRGVTKATTWDVTAQFSQGQVKGQTVTKVKFADFGMSVPRVAVVVSVEDTMSLELDFVVKKAA